MARRDWIATLEMAESPIGYDQLEVFNIVHNSGPLLPGILGSVEQDVE